MQARTVAIVTGASRGLGHALALGLMAPDVALITVSRRHNADLAQHAQLSGCSLQQIQGDLANPAAAERIANQILGKLDIQAERYLLINNAGTVDPVSLASGLDNAAAITAAFSLNVTCPMLMIAALLRLPADGNVDRRILNISSGAGRNPMPGWGVYCATKAALDHYSRVVQAENHGVRIASLAPGVIDTGMQEHIRGSSRDHFPDVQRFIHMHEAGQLSAPADVAARILDYINREDFGTTVLDDIRHYA
ncbi:SDR family oxidoreductase [Parapusillimonas sp. SGNA-6]|nr:SDR family oxidoreductase [Parapusillimonas sp. SGNA-6]